MLTISKKASYGLRIMLYLAQHDKLSSTADIAQAENIPHQFVEQITNHLRQEKLVQSKRGVKGGYTLAKAKNQISMCDIIVPLEGKVKLAACLAGDNCQRQAHCLAKSGWAQIQKQLFSAMQEISLADLLNNKMEVSRDKP